MVEILQNFVAFSENMNFNMKVFTAIKKVLVISREIASAYKCQNAVLEVI